MNLADQVKEFARNQYIEPARRRGEATVRIVAGDVHRALRFVNRVPTVCTALRSTGFLRNNGLILEKREGPPSGPGHQGSLHVSLPGEGRWSQCRAARSRISTATRHRKGSLSPAGWG